jgi:L-aminopeptidase/D-esterase-like protein
VLQVVADHDEFKDMATGVSRISEDRHYSASAAAQEGQVCAGDHGTHVGALAGGYEFGAGKDVTIVSGACRGCQLLCGVRVV